jgi:ribonuclease P protein component
MQNKSREYDSFFLSGARWKFAALAGKKLGTAPLRNRHRRWAREVFRQHRSALPVSGSLIVRFNRPCRDYAEVESTFLAAYRMASQTRRRDD